MFGAAFAGGWALAILFGLDDFGAHILQAILFGLGVVIMVAFIRAAQRVEPFTRRALSAALRLSSRPPYTALILRSGLWPRLEGWQRVQAAILRDAAQDARLLRMRRSVWRQKPLRHRR